MATRKLLLPYHFTRLDQKALDFVIDAFGRIEGITVTVFNAYTPIPEIDTEATSVTVKLKGSLSYLSQKLKKRKRPSMRSKINSSREGLGKAR
ncbi:MAG: hypothetical protein PVH43_02275 [Desulfobacterales bacterium]|jgi:hypothetical protein